MHYAASIRCSPQGTSSRRRECSSAGPFARALRFCFSLLRTFVRSFFLSFYFVLSCSLVLSRVLFYSLWFALVLTRSLSFVLTFLFFRPATVRLLPPSVSFHATRSCPENVSIKIVCHAVRTMLEKMSRKYAARHFCNKFKNIERLVESGIAN